MAATRIEFLTALYGQVDSNLLLELRCIIQNRGNARVMDTYRRPASNG
jgi:hypothetical protein